MEEGKEEKCRCFYLKANCDVRARMVSCIQLSRNCLHCFQFALFHAGSTPLMTCLMALALRHHQEQAEEPTEALLLAAEEQAKWVFRTDSSTNRINSDRPAEMDLMWERTILAMNL